MKLLFFFFSLFNKQVMIFENCIYFLHIELHKPHAIYLYIKHSGSSVQYTVFYFLFCIKVVSSNIFTPLTDNYYIYTDARYFSHFLINFFFFFISGLWEFLPNYLGLTELYVLLHPAHVELICPTFCKSGKKEVKKSQIGRYFSVVLLHTTQS